jgi:sugar lactone lactonase YvrE
MVVGLGRVRSWGGLAVFLTVFAVWSSAAEAAFVFDTKWGSLGTAPGQFNLPRGVGGGISSDVYVADSGNNRIQRFTSSGGFIGAWGSFGSTAGQFSNPGGIAVDSDGNVYVADTGNGRIQKFDQDGVFLSQLGSAGSGDGQFQGPYGVAVDSSGNIFVADTGNNRVQKFSPAGAFITKWSGSGTISGSFNTPAGITVDNAGNVFVTDYGHNRIQKFDSNGAFLTMWGAIGTGMGALWGPYGIDVDSVGNVYVAENQNHRIQKFTSNGTFVEVTGSMGSGNGQFRYPSGLSLDLFDAVYVADTSNHRVQRYQGSRGVIVVRKDAVPDDPQDFDFTTGGGLTPGSFQLDDDGSTGNGLSNVRTFTVNPGSGYSVSETSVPSGWDLASATCSDGSPPSNIDVAAGETVTCTFTNVKRTRLIVKQDALPDDPQDFDFTTGGGLSPASFQLDDDGNDSNALSSTRLFDNLAPASNYSVAQSTPPGWSAPDATCSDGSSVTHIAISPGEVVTCTFTNVSPAAGRIMVVKDAQPNDPQDFDFTGGGGIAPSSFQLDDDGDNGNTGTELANSRQFIVTPGSGYSLSETNPSGWFLHSATCSDGSPVSNIDVSPAETVTCTFVNRRTGRLIVTKDAQPNDAQDFDFTTGGGLSPSSFQLDDDGTGGTLQSNQIFADVVPGSGYSVSEVVPPGWDQLSATCSDGSPVSSINIASGEIVTCTFTNRKHARLIVAKDAQPDDPQDFDFTAGGGLSPSSFQLDDDGDDSNGLASSRTFADLAPGSGYSVSEGAATGWQQLSPSCSDGSPASNVSLSAGETVTCTFTNLRHGRITVVQDTVPDDPQDFGYTTTGLAPGTFDLDDDGNDSNGLSSTIVFDDLIPSNSGYSVSQSTPAGWLLESGTCSDGSSPSNITVSPGEHITCTFTDSRRGRIIVRKDARPNNPVDFDFTAGGGLSPSSFQLDDDGDETNGLSSSRVFVVDTGSGYSVAENPPPSPWTLASANCSDGSLVSNIAVSPGEILTCTFVNTGGVSNYVRPKAATPMRVSMLPAYLQCTAPNRTHGPPLAHPSCNPPQQLSSAVTVGTPDANAAPTNSTAYVRYDVRFFAGGIDDTDVRIRSVITDLRCKAGTTACGSANAADGADYVGEVRATTILRITDALSEGDSATTVGIPFGATFGCTASSSTSIGGQCTLDTTADAVVPGSAPEGRRSVWEFEPVQVLDGGADGMLSTSGDNSLLLAQGVFVP